MREVIKQQNAVLICSWRWIRVSLGRCDGPVLVGEGAGQDLLIFAFEPKVALLKDTLAPTEKRQ